jgi:hypothetical protein
VKRILIGRSEGKKSLEKLGVVGWLVLVLKCSLKTNVERK